MDGAVYPILKLVHVAAVIMFLGNIVTGLFWKLHADRTRDPRVIAHTFDGIIRSDRWFTLPGVALIIVSGMGAAGVGGLKIFATFWIWTALVLFAISGIAFVARVAPLQVKLRDLARGTSAPADFDWATYGRWSRQWEFWGLVALITPVAALVLMVLKPT